MPINKKKFASENKRSACRTSFILELGIYSFVLPNNQDQQNKGGKQKMKTRAGMRRWTNRWGKKKTQAL